jgi:hypothetical protein
MFPDFPDYNYSLIHFRKLHESLLFDRNSYLRMIVCVLCAIRILVRCIIHFHPAVPQTYLPFPFS